MEQGPWTKAQQQGLLGLILNRQTMDRGPWPVWIRPSNPLLERGTAGCTRTRHLRCACGLLTYCYCNDCTRTKVLGKASNPSSGHHFNQGPWTKYLICKEHGPGATDIHLEALLWLKHLCDASIALLIFPLDLCQRRAVTKGTLQCKLHSQSFPQSKVYMHQNRHTNALLHEPLACRAE